MRLDSRLRGNDSVWCGEAVFVAHEPLCCNVTGYRCATASNTKRATRLGHNASRDWLAAIGSALLGAMPTHWLMGLLGVVLLISAVKTFQHAR